MVGNPPWERMKLQQVEWFADRDSKIALQQLASERKRMIEELQRHNSSLDREFKQANERALSALRMTKHCGSYPYFSKGDVNLYSLFVERAMSLVNTHGLVGLLTPIGIATDKTAASFFADRINSKSVKAFFAFENKRGWLFPDIHREEQPSVFVFTRSTNQFEILQYAVRIKSWEEFNDSNRRFPMSTKMLKRVNPNSKTAPLFRNRKDTELVFAIYSRLPVFADYSSKGEVKTWPVKYSTMFHMSDKSHLFRTREELEQKEKAWVVDGNCFVNDKSKWVPLYEGKMVQIYNHRFANVRVNPNNVSAQGVADKLDVTALNDPDVLPEPRFWVDEEEIKIEGHHGG